MRAEQDRPPAVQPVTLNSPWVPPRLSGHMAGFFWAATSLILRIAIVAIACGLLRSGVHANVMHMQVYCYACH